MPARLRLRASQINYYRLLLKCCQYNIKGAFNCPRRGLIISSHPTTCYSVWLPEECSLLYLFITLLKSSYFVPFPEPLATCPQSLLRLSRSHRSCDGMPSDSPSGIQHLTSSDSWSDHGLISRYDCDKGGRSCANQKP